MTEWCQVVSYDPEGLSFIKLNDKTLVPFTIDKVRNVHGLTSVVGRFVEAELNESRQVIWITL